MDSASPFLSVLIIVAVFLATICFAMVLVLARRSCHADNVLATDPQPDEQDVPPTRLGWLADVRQPTEELPQTRQEQAEMLEHWAMQHSPQPARWRPVGAQFRSNRFVTCRIKHVADNATFMVEIKVWRTVFMLLLIAQRETRIPIVDLCYHGRQLQENQTLHECGFRNGDFIELTLFPRSGLVSV